MAWTEARRLGRERYSARLAERDAEMRAMMDAGVLYREIAATFGVGKRTVARAKLEPGKWCGPEWALLEGYRAGREKLRERRETRNALIVDALASGATVNALAAAHGLLSSSIRVIARNAGVRWRKAYTSRTLTPVLIAYRERIGHQREALETRIRQVGAPMGTRTLTVAQIAALAGCSTMAVSRVLRDVPCERLVRVRVR